MTGQVVSKVGNYLSIKVLGMAYNTRDEHDIFELGDSVRVTFAGGTRKIIAIKLFKVSDKTADEIFDEFICDTELISSNECINYSMEDDGLTVWEDDDEMGCDYGWSRSYQYLL